jgi:hypothetical protein
VTVDPDRVDEVEGNDDNDRGLGAITGDGIGSAVILPLNGMCGREIGTSDA